MSTFVRVSGVPHHIRVDGTGPVCVLSAGLGMAWFDWDPVVPFLAPHRTVVRFDRPGLGLSGHTRAWPTLTGEAERIARVLDAAGVAADTPATVVGHSLAGFHCEAFARLFPERTAGLVLVDASVEESPRARRAPELGNAFTRACAALLSTAGVPRALGPLMRRAVVRAGRYTGGEPASYDLVRSAYSTSRFLHAALAENVTYRDQAVELASLRERLPLDAPVTVLAAYTGGSRRRWLDRQGLLAEQLGGVLRVSEPAGHLVMLDRPRDVAEAVLETRARPPLADKGEERAPNTP